LFQPANLVGAGKHYHSQAAPPYSDEIHFCAAFGGLFQPANLVGAGNRRHRSQALPQPGAPPFFRMKSISVGAGLLANTSFDPASTSQTHRVRGQAELA
jgi:hypothetical protein